MSRTTIKLNEEAIIAHMRKGDSAEVIAAALGNVASVPTIRRRMARLKGKVREARLVARAERAGVAVAPSTSSGALPEEDAVPEQSTLGQLDYWLTVATRNAKEAETEGDVDTLAKMARLAATILEMRRKATPVPPPDPNENPDMIAAKESARAEFHRLIDHKLMRTWRPS